LSWGITPATHSKSLNVVPEETNKKTAGFASNQGQMKEDVQKCG
jgi:hypothetical protein